MTVGTAWERFHAGEEPHGVRGEVLTSWRRSRISGVDPRFVEPPHVETDLDTHLVRVAVPIMERMAEMLVGDRSCLALSDARGSVVWRWVSEPMLRGALDRLSVVQGFCFDEAMVGTNGLGTALETGGLAVVRGSEHFVQRFHEVTCVAAPVRHPVTRRTVGAVNVTCRAQDTSPLLAVVVRKLVDEVQAALRDAASRRERALLDAFLTEQRSASGPVLTVGDDVVIANAAATALGLEQHAIWDEVRHGADGMQVTLPSSLTARLRLVRDGPTTTGAVLSVIGPAAPEPAPRTRGPRRDRWGRLIAQVRALAATGPVAVRGEPGSGRTTLLSTVFGPETAVLDAAHPVTVPHGMPVVVRHADVLSAHAVPALATALTGEQRPVGVTIPPDGHAPLLDAIGASAVSLPPLRRRTDEVAGLARQELRRHGRNLVLAPDALAALVRYGWPGNVAELVRTLRDAAGRARAGVVGADALPEGIRVAATGRALTPLERAESSVIATVLAECGGNKSAAARELGISRTALYAKLRAYRR
ncbi:helix-turn-helix domain-containing protein [Pseudonocardia sp.]|uniref:sigma-54-dependent Fis family transcriptional regulator n=1 Tax=Pseudonocardia sp. TaxID=60912 RepID=UPI0026169E61|nr:helix-turn-helix domain-containing protein [Pseudonocardia sp.]